MKTYKYNIQKICFLLAICASQLTMAQGNIDVTYPEVGKPCPDLTLRNISYFNKEQATTKDFLGKWLILDLFDKDCGNCIAVFPRYNKIQKEQQDKLQIVLVGRLDKENLVHSVYEKFRKNKNLQLACSFDSLLFHRLDVNSSPFVIIIDPKGIVRGITGYVEEQDIKDFLLGKQPELQKVYREHEKRPLSTYNPYGSPLLTYGNGGEDTSFLFRSLLSGYDPAQNNTGDPGSIKDTSEVSAFPVNSAERKSAIEFNQWSGSARRFEVLRVTVLDLYRYAFLGRSGGFGLKDPLYGQFSNRTILEIKDTSIFDPEGKSGHYNYSLIVPPAKDTKEFRMKVMQHDLENYFGYGAKIETRMMPYWRLVVSPEAMEKLKTKGGPTYITPFVHSQYLDYCEMKNVSIKRMLFLLPHSDMPYIDETGIMDNIDLELSWPGIAIPTFEDMKKSLLANGLYLVTAYKKMKVLVIHDPKLAMVDADKEN